MRCNLAGDDRDRHVVHRAVVRAQTDRVLIRGHAELSHRRVAPVSRLSTSARPGIVWIRGSRDSAGGAPLRRRAARAASRGLLGGRALRALGGLRLRALACAEAALQLAVESVLARRDRLLHRRGRCAAGAGGCATSGRLRGSDGRRDRRHRCHGGSAATPGVSARA
jgi:hypothetical protein